MIRKKRVRNLGRNAPFLKKGEDLYIGINIDDANADRLKQIGFRTLEAGNSMLPAPVGPVTKYNAEGRQIIHRELPMETLYRLREWEWELWDGTKMSKIVEVPYKRYPRTFVPSPSIELTVHSNTEGKTLLLSPLFRYEDANVVDVTHAVNVFLEIFGECTFFTGKMEQIIKAPVRRLNWKLLPSGKRPWKELQKELAGIIQLVPAGKRTIVTNRLETINTHEPIETAVGEGGFSGYVVFCFPKTGVNILESLLYGNATYILGENWERISKHTKMEILDQKLHLGRVIHREGWHEGIDKLFRSRKSSK